MSQFVGKWKLAIAEDAVAISTSGKTGTYSELYNETNINTRYAHFEDNFQFDEIPVGETEGNYENNFNGGKTYVETWQGATSDGKATPLAPFNNSNEAKWSIPSAGKLLLEGNGVYAGLPNYFNNGDDKQGVYYDLTTHSTTSGVNPIWNNGWGVACKNEYDYEFSANDNILTLYLNYGGTNWVRFILVKEFLTDGLNSVQYNSLKLAVTKHKADASKFTTGIYRRYGTIENWDTRLITDMSQLFEDDDTFNLDLTGWNVANVQNMSEMFKNCAEFNQKLEWDVTACLNMESMFHGCSKLVEQKFSNSNGVTNFSNMFRNCVVLKKAELDCSAGTDLYEMFLNAGSALTGTDSLEVSLNNTDNATNMSYMFSTSKFNQNLSTVGITFDKVINMSHMFYSCSSFNNGGTNLTINAPLATNIKDLFLGAGLQNINISLTIPKVSDLSNAFAMNPNFTGELTIDNSIHHSGHSHTHTITLVNTSYMLNGCTRFNNSLGNNFDTSNVTDMSFMFSGCESYNSALGTNFNTSSVTNMASMFAFCRKFNQSLGNNFNTSNVENMNAMFAECHDFNQSLGNNFNTSNVTDMKRMFLNAKDFTQSLGDDFDTGNVEDFRDMFVGVPYNASVLNFTFKSGLDKDYDFAFDFSPMTPTQYSSLLQSLNSKANFKVSGKTLKISSYRLDNDTAVATAHAGLEAAGLVITDAGLITADNYTGYTASPVVVNVNKQFYKSSSTHNVNNAPTETLASDGKVFIVDSGGIDGHYDWMRDSHINGLPSWFSGVDFDPAEAKLTYQHILTTQTGYFNSTLSGKIILDNGSTLKIYEGKNSTGAELLSCASGTTSVNLTISPNSSVFIELINPADKPVDYPGTAAGISLVLERPFRTFVQTISLEGLLVSKIEKTPSTYVTVNSLINGDSILVDSVATPVLVKSTEIGNKVELHKDLPSLPHAINGSIGNVIVTRKKFKTLINNKHKEFTNEDYLSCKDSSGNVVDVPIRDFDSTHSLNLHDPSDGLTLTFKDKTLPTLMALSSTQRKVGTGPNLGDELASFNKVYELGVVVRLDGTIR